MAVWDDQRVKPHVRAAALEISKTFSITNIGGFASSGHVSNSDHYTGHALDVMCDLRMGSQVSAWTLANAARLSVKYVIWNRQIWQNGKWTKYSGSSPHIDHVHISFNTAPGDGSAPIQGFAGEGGEGGLSANEGCLKALLQVFGI